MNVLLLKFSKLFFPPCDNNNNFCIKLVITKTSRMFDGKTFLRKVSDSGKETVPSFYFQKLNNQQYIVNNYEIEDFVLIAAFSEQEGPKLLVSHSL